MKPHELKSFQRRLNDVKEKLRIAQIEEKQKKKEIAELNREQNELQKKLRAAKEKEVTVSEHAMLRYFERVLGYDLDEIRAKIVPDETKAFVDQFRSGEFPVNGEFRIKVKDKTVITILKKGSK